MRQPAADSSGALLVLRGVGKAFSNGVTALDNVDLAIREGDFLSLLGPSGCGKSTALRLIAGLSTPTAGAIEWLGSRGVDRSDIGFVFQGFNLMQTMTARDNIVLPLRLNGLPVDEAWLADLVDLLGIGSELARKPHEISGGQQQRVAIARALITRPRVILADEPTGNLDTHASAQILAHLRQACRELGQSVVMVTHDPTAASYAGQVILFADGKVAGHVTDPTPDAVLAGLDALAGVAR